MSSTDPTRDATSLTPDDVPALPIVPETSTEGPSTPTASLAATTPKRIAIYVFAWDQQKRETILNELKAYAKEHGYAIGRIYLDSTRACPKLRRLLADAKKGSFALVLVRWVLNLGNRSRLGGLRRARELDAVGVRVESVGEPWFDVHLRALEWIFEDDCRRHERSTKALEARRAAGQPAGPIEYGYAVDDDGNVVPDAYEQRVIARIYALHDAGWSQRQIAEQLEREGFTSRQGTPLSHRQVGRILARRE